MGSIIGYILLFIMLGITLFNIYATATKKKRDQANEMKYNALFDGRKRSVIAWDGDLRTFRFNEFGGAELVDDETGVKILVHLREETLTLQASTGKFKKKSFIVKSITEMAKGFVEFLNKINEPKNEATDKEKNN